jgi:hypothetical protein
VFHRLVSHNDDLRRLVETGYAVAFDSNHLVVRDIPYLDQRLDLQWGALVAKLEFIDLDRVKQTDHQVYFAGAVPYGLDGNPIPNLGGGSMTIPLSEASADVVVQRSFSNKPKKTGVFDDFFHKIESYVAIISGPAMEKFNASPLTFRCATGVPTNSVFKIHDTLTSRAEIGDLAAKFKDDVIGVIGLGGTGAYLLDLLVRTPVREIRGFDGDAFHVHNAFRSPGAVTEGELGKPKAHVYHARYEGFRDGLTLESKYIDASSEQDLEGLTFAFVCVDKGSARSEIFKALISKRIPFIDVGMGLSRKDRTLNGMLRVTYYSSEDAERVLEKGLSELGDPDENLYRTNIQIGELNALNACLALIKFKQIRGFYFEETPVYGLLWEIGDLKTVTEAEL